MCLILAENICIFSSRIFLAKLPNFVLKLQGKLATITDLLKYNKFGLNGVLIKQNLPNSIILTPNNGGF